MKSELLKRLILKIIRIADLHFKIMKDVIPSKNLTIGKDSDISRGSHLDLTGSITVGNNCMITNGVRIYTHSHYLSKNRDFSLKDDIKVISKNPIIIEDNVIIWDNAMIMPSVEIIHKGCVILAGTVLVKSTTGEHQIWGGNPAKLIKMRE